MTSASPPTGRAPIDGYDAAPFLTAALAEPTYEKRRKMLRDIVGRVIDARIKPDEIKDTFGSSPLIGEGERRINPAPTKSGLRDALGEPTLIGLAAWASSKTTALSCATPSQVLAAIQNPAAHSVPSGTSVTGYEFGRPATLTDERINTIKELHAMTSTATAPTVFNSSEWGAAVLLTIHDAVVRHLINETGRAAASDIDEFSRSTISTMRGHISEPARMEGINAMREARGVHDYSTAPSLGALAAEPRELAKIAIEAALQSGADFGDATEEAPVAEAPKREPRTFPTVDAAVRPVLDAMLTAAKLPTVEDIIRDLTRADGLDAEIERLRASVARASAAALPSKFEATSDGTIPEGVVKMMPADKALGIKVRSLSGIEVPTFEWAGPHPHVPAIDPNYVLRPAQVLPLVWALVTNKKTWLAGHTGTGKSTLVEQVCARLGWPVMRVNFDSEITRMDLIGRDTLATDGDGKTISRFVDGILPMAMSGPYTLLLDEIDFIRADVSYVLQRALEDKGLLITEDGGRLIKPNPMFRIVATGNTRGQGDEFGIYQGARAQSVAFLNRFTCWIDVDYLPTNEEKALVAKLVPDLPGEQLDRLSAYTVEHRKAFTNGEIITPLSPRGIIACAEAMVTFLRIMPKPKDAVRLALDTTLLNAASLQDRTVLRGLADRTFA